MDGVRSWAHFNPHPNPNFYPNPHRNPNPNLTLALPPSDLHDGAARQRAYELLNLCYQVGVFFSRSSGNLIVLRRPALWAIAWLQVANPNPNPNPNPSPNPNPNPNPNTGLGLRLRLNPQASPLRACVQTPPPRARGRSARAPTAARRGTRS